MIQQFCNKFKEVAIAPFIICLLCLVLAYYFQLFTSKAPYNYLLLILFTVSKSLVLGFLAANRPDVLQYSIITIGIIFIVLFFLNCQTKFKSTISLEILIVILLSLISVGLLLIFYQNRDLIICSISMILYLLVSSLIDFLKSSKFSNTFLFTQFIVSDVHSIVDLQERNFQLKTNDYVLVCFTLYLDVFKVFAIILSLIFLSIFYLFALFLY